MDRIPQEIGITGITPSSGVPRVPDCSHAGMRGDLTILSDDPGAGNPEAFTAVRYTIRSGKVIWRGDRR